MLIGDKKFCMCGLSSSQPLCDKSHVLTKDESDGKLYWYQNGKREEVIQESDGGDCSGHCGDGGCGHCQH